MSQIFQLSISLLAIFVLLSFTSCSSAKTETEGESSGIVFTGGDNNLLGDFGEVVFKNGFDSFETVLLRAEPDGSFKASGDAARLNINGSGIYGIYNSAKPINGYFYADVMFEGDGNAGLFIAHEKDGKADPDNYTSVAVVKDSEGKRYIRVYDCQNGNDDVLDNTTKIMSGDKLHFPYYSIPLDSSKYSVKYESTTGKLRIIYDKPAALFHFYVSVSKTVDGKEYEDWLELASSSNWTKKTTNYYVGVFVAGGEAPGNESEHEQSSVFSNLTVRYVEIDDTTENPGFAATRRNFTFSGYNGDAMVVSFDKSRTDFENNKFVFWDRANYTPVWVIDNKCLFSYEFTETWSGIGCFEPMSDRVNAFSNRVEVVEDSNVRKILKWEYNLINPNYQYPQGGIQEKPISTEYYIFYPDGTGIRHIQYKPKTFGWHELGEYIIIADSSSKPSYHIPDNALTITNNDGLTYNFNKESFNKINKNNSLWKEETLPDIESWNEFIAIQNFKNGLSVYSSWPNTAEIPEMYSGYKISPDISWHNVSYSMAHWPVGRMPFYEDFKTMALWQGRQVAHTSTLGIEMWNADPDGNGNQFDDNFKIDESDGRIYREWFSLIGLTGENGQQEIRDKTAAWMYPPIVSPLDINCRYVGYDYGKMEIILETEDDNFSFSLTPPQKSKIINPVLRIKGFKGDSVNLNINGTPLEDDSYEYFINDGELLIWMDIKTEGALNINIY